MGRHPLDVVSLWLLFAAVCGLTGVALEGGYRLGRWRRARTTEEKEGPVGTMVGSVLALLAFMLAFTFGMAASRFEARRQAVLDEANAIGTTYLRTRLLPEPQRGESARLLREYVDVRLRGVLDGNLEEAVARSEQIHDLLWAHATQVAEAKPTPITATYIQSLNEMIDVHAARLQAGPRSRIPVTIWVGLFAIAVFGMGSVGYQSGLSGTQRSPEMLALVLAFASVMYLIADLDRPQEGLLVVGQQALFDVQRGMTGAIP